MFFPAKYLRKSISSVIRKVEGLSLAEQAGLRACYRLMSRNRALVISTLITSAIAALMEGSTIAIVVLAVKLMTGDLQFESVKSVWIVGGYIYELSVDQNRGAIFSLFIFAAVFAQVGKSVFQYLSRSTSIRIGIRVARQMQEEITYKIMKLSYPEIMKYASGTLAEILKMGASVPRAVIAGIASKSILAGFLLSIYLIGMLSISVKLTLCAIVVSVLFSVVLTTFNYRLRKLGQIATDSMLKANQITIEYLNASRLIRIFNGGRVVENKINHLRLEILSAQQKIELLRATVEPLMDVITIIGVGAFLLIGYMVVGATISSALTNLLIFLVILNRMIPQVRNLNQCRMAFAHVRASIEVVGSFLELKNKTSLQTSGKPFTRLTKDIQFNDVSFTYPGESTAAIKNIDFSIKQGSTIALVGPSGSGKSTILDLILGLYEPSHGTILIDGIDLKNVDQGTWLERIGIVDQELFLLNLSVRENIMFVRSQCTEEETLAAAQLANAHEFISDLKHGYDTIIGDQAYKLSGGQKQRVAIARALLKSPGIIIFDEATSSLDSASEQKIQETLRNLQGSRTIIVAAHRFSTIADADTIICLEQGSIVEQGSRSQLLANSGHFSKWWHQQSIGVADKDT